jgi:hypothetical protein
MAFQIPKEGRKSLGELLKASPKFLEAFYNALKDCEPRLLSRDQSQLDAKLSTFPEGNAKSLGGYLRLINGTLSASDDAPSENVVADLLAAAQATGEKELAPSLSGWEKVREFLTKTFALDKVRVSARALTLYYDTYRHMHDVRILTDARPVFSKRAVDDPDGFVILHTMRVDYYEDGQAKDWYISLDFDDLQAIKKAVDRAIDKQNSLQRFLKKTDSVVFISNPVSDEAST